MVKPKIMMIRWGRGFRKYKVKNPNLYQKIGKKGRYNLYAKRKLTRKSTKKKLEKSRRSSREIKAIEKIKKGWTQKDKIQIKKEREIEKRLLKRIVLVPNLNKKSLVKSINPTGKIIYGNKIYESYGELNNNKKEFYLNLLKSGNKKIEDKLYAMRRQILQDGMVIEVDLHGTLNKGNLRIVNLGTLVISGIMIEDAEFIETNIMGSSGTIGEIEKMADSLARSKGGAGARIERTPLKFDSTQIYITSVKLKINYA